MLKKLPLIIGICIAILLMPISSAANLDTNVDDDLEEKPDIEALNNDVEIISFFRGACTFINRKGLFIDEPIDIRPGGFGFDIFGLKQPVSGFYDIFFRLGSSPEIVRAPRFIGIVHEVNPHFIKVWGIALGDIEYS